MFTGVKGFLFALDPKTGKTIRDFGENGSINLGSGLNTPGVTYQDMLIVGGVGGKMVHFASSSCGLRSMRFIMALHSMIQVLRFEGLGM